jgi:hypothetical protein
MHSRVERALTLLVSDRPHKLMKMFINSFDRELGRSLYRVSQEEWTKLRENVPYVEV